MLNLSRKYLKPGKDLRRLAIMEALADAERVSQHEIAARAGMSASMVNQYLRELQQDGFVEFSPVDSKSYRYHITSAGQDARRHEFAGYCSEIVQSYTALKNLVRHKLAGLEERGALRLVLWGASETCEVALSALQNTAFRIVGLVDSDPAKHGSLFHNHVVSPPSILESLGCQAVVITSFARQNEIHRQVNEQFAHKGLEVARL